MLEICHLSFQKTRRSFKAPGRRQHMIAWRLAHHTAQGPVNDVFSHAEQQLGGMLCKHQHDPAKLLHSGNSFSAGPCVRAVSKDENDVSGIGPGRAAVRKNTVIPITPGALGHWSSRDALTLRRSLLSTLSPSMRECSFMSFVSCRRRRPSSSMK